MEADAPGAELGQLVDGVDGVDHRAGRAAERVTAGVADGPETEREAMPLCRRLASRVLEAGAVCVILSVSSTFMKSRP